MAPSQKPLTAEEATSPVTPEATAEVRAWQAEKIKAGLKAADEGRFASPEAVKAVIQKFIPNG
jgi:predicted transcriptional regulator